jgi:cyanophycinase
MLFFFRWNKLCVINVQQNAMTKPKGVLIPIGGHEDRKGHKDILERVIIETHRRNPRVEIITVASEESEKLSEEYITAFEDLGLSDVTELYIDERHENSDFLDRLDRCDAVFFSGGNQLRLTTLLGGTAVIRLLKKRYQEDKNFVIAGTSAGASAMSTTMIIKGGNMDGLIKGQLQLNHGLDFINGLFIDTHFAERGRMGRMIQTVVTNPAVLGLGLGEDTGAVIHNGDELETIGSGLIFIADAHDLIYTDLTEIDDGEPITAEGVIVHVLGKGKKFSLSERKLVRRD